MKKINWKGFTCLDNSILFDDKLSDQAKIFLMKIRHILTTKQSGFNPTKAFILRTCNLTKCKYDKVMQELKNFVEIVRSRSGKSWVYTYNLLAEIFTPVVKEAKKVIEKVIDKANDFIASKKTKKANSWNKPKTLAFKNHTEREYKPEDYENLYGWDD